MEADDSTKEKRGRSVEAMPTLEGAEFDLYHQLGMQKALLAC